MEVIPAFLATAQTVRLSVGQSHRLRHILNRWLLLVEAPCFVLHGYSIPTRLQNERHAWVVLSRFCESKHEAARTSCVIISCTLFRPPQVDVRDSKALCMLGINVLTFPVL